MDGIVSEVVVVSGLEVTVQEQQRRVKHDLGEGEMERYDTCANTFLQTHEPRVYVHTHEDVRMCADKLCKRKMCVQQVSVYTPHRRTHCSRCYMCTKP